MTSAPDERQEALAAMGAQTSGPWGQQSSLNTDRVQRMGVRHLRPDDPLRRAVLNKGKVLSKTCSECKLEKKADHYSKTQLKKSDHARCNECVAGLAPTPDPVMEAENENKMRPPRGLEGRICWGCAKPATGHEVKCPHCKRRALRCRRTAPC